MTAKTKNQDIYKIANKTFVKTTILYKVHVLSVIASCSSLLMPYYKKVHSRVASISPVTTVQVPTLLTSVSSINLNVSVGSLQAGCSCASRRKTISFFNKNRVTYTSAHLQATSGHGNLNRTYRWMLSLPVNRMMAFISLQTSPLFA